MITITAGWVSGNNERIESPRINGHADRVSYILASTNKNIWSHP